jgi:hypothetical protein
MSKKILTTGSYYLTSLKHRCGMFRLSEAIEQFTAENIEQQGMQ